MRFSIALKLVWKTAASETAALAHEFIEPEHILLALMNGAELVDSKLRKRHFGQDVNVDYIERELLFAPEVVMQAGLESNAFSIELKSIHKQGTYHHSPGSVVHRSDRSRVLFDESKKIASSMGSSTLSAWHLLLAILGESESDGCRLLREAGVDPDTLVESIGSRLKRDGKLESSDSDPDHIPDDRIGFVTGDVLVSARFTDVINYSMYHCNVPIVECIHAHNRGDAPSEPFSITLQINGFSDPCEILIPPIEPLGRIALKPVQFQLKDEKLIRQITQGRAKLQMNVGQESTPAASKDVTILGLWSWPLTVEGLKTIPAFVSPHNFMVEKIIDSAQARLKPECGCRSFLQLLNSPIEEPEVAILESLYNYFKSFTQITYMNPHIDVAGESQTKYQKVRSPQVIFSDFELMKGSATCIDLTLLFAGCLERAGLFPLIILAGKEPNIPDHAFAGCWLSDSPGGKPYIYNKDNLLKEIDDPNLLLLECLGFSEGCFPEKLDFLSACESAKKCIIDAGWIYAIDIGTSRPPYGSIIPMENPIAPEVSFALEAAKEFSLRKKRPTVETSQLLYGVIQAGGEVITHLFREAGYDRENVLAAIEENIDSMECEEDPRHTSNYLRCLHKAERNARNDSSQILKEADLIFAVLTIGEDSTAVNDNCEAAGINLKSLLDLLNRKYFSAKQETPVSLRFRKHDRP